MAKSEYEYRAEMQKLVMLGHAFASIVNGMPLDEMADCVSHAENFGVFADPTQWIAAQQDGRLGHQRGAIDAARAFLESWRKAGLPFDAAEDADAE